MGLSFGVMVLVEGAVCVGVEAWATGGDVEVDGRGLGGQWERYDPGEDEAASGWSLCLWLVPATRLDAT